MARSLSGLGQRSWRLMTSTTTLAAWRWRQQWFLLLVTGVGVIAAIMLVCSIPLFSAIMLTAGLRGTVSSTPQSSQITVSTQIAGFSTKGVQQANSIVTASLQQHLGAYMQGQTRLELATPQFGVVDNLQYKMSLYGASLSTSASHLKLLDGRLPDEHGDGLEVALTSSVLDALGLHVGSTVTLQVIAADSSPFRTYAPYILMLPMRVVGSFQIKGDGYWHGNDFEFRKTSDNQQLLPIQGLVSFQALLRYFDKVATAHQSDLVYFPQAPSLYWYDALVPTKIALNDLDNLISQLGHVQSDYSKRNASEQNYPSFPYLSQTVASGQVFATPTDQSILEKFRGQLAVMQVPVTILALQITGLALFFVSVMAGLLVDRQAEIIAVLRSRGASGRQVLGSLMTQGLGISLAALLIGPPLALLLVYVVASRLLPATQDSLDVITRSPMQAMLSVAWYAAAAVGMALLTLIFSFYRAARMDVVSLRREITRATRRPLWQRLRLDLWGLVVALTGYALSLYLASTGQFLNANAQALVASPLTLIAPMFLLLAGILAFLRFFPPLLRLIASLAQRGRSASSILALAQMARSPRQPMRMALLLGLATAFAIFSLVFSASQAQRAQDIAAYQAGGDFSGSLPTAATLLPVAQETELYRQIPGVTSATVGYASRGDVVLSLGASTSSSFVQQIRAVDTATFAATVAWTSQDSTQALSDLLAQLQSWKQRALQRGVVPALVDASAWNGMHLHAGSTFSLNDRNATQASAQYLVIGMIDHIPTVDDSVSGGMLVDLSTLQAIQAKNPFHTLINYVWLRTSDDPTALAHVREMLTTSRLRLENLNDRRKLLADLATDPLALNLLATLSIGASATLLLALVASVLTPLLSARARQTSFVVLRALGAPPRQVVRILSWEQGLIFALALLLGCAFGALLSLSMVPVLIFTSIPASYTATSSSSQIFAIQQLLPAQIILPLSLGVALLVLVGICVLALRLIGHVVLRPIMGQALRINED